jgi:hypothetical protein
MPVISLAEVAANRRTIEVDLGLPPAENGDAQTLTVTYRVNALTPADELIFSTTRGKDAVPEEQMTALLGFFTRLVSSWALTETEGGKTVSVEPKALRSLPVSIIRNVLQACMADINDPKGSTTTAAS